MMDDYDERLGSDAGHRVQGRVIYETEPSQKKQVWHGGLEGV